MEKGFIPYKRSNICYRKWGYGNKIIFALHGYGENAESFSFLEHVLPDNITLIAIDLPFHGETNWNDDIMFSVVDLIAIIDLLTENKHAFSLLGYSMGGRVALHLLSKIPERIKQLSLIAPDGLHLNFWQWFATQTAVGNNFFKFTMKKPHWFFAIMKIGFHLKLINKSIFNFAHYYLDDEKQRDLLYKRWTIMRRFRPRLNLLKKIIIEFKTPIKILFGKYDRIIVAQRGKRFAKGLEELIQIHEINAGHLLLKEKYSIEIVSLFNK